MPVDPMIARGINPLGAGLANTMLDIEGMKLERQRANMFDQRNALLEHDQRRQWSQEDAQAAAEAEKDQLWDAAMDAEDIETAMRIDPESTLQAVEALKMFKGMNAPAVAPIPIEEQRLPSGRYLATQGGKPVGSPWAPPQPSMGRAPSAGPSPGAAPARPSRPLPTGALRIVDEAKQAVAAASDSQKLVSDAITTLQQGNVKLGAVENVKSRAKNFGGMSTDNSRAFASIKQTLEKLRNNYLLLAKGVQTEGDAQRAWNSEIGESVQNDNALALQQLQKAQGMIDRAIEAQNGRIETVYGNFGQEMPDAQPAQADAAADPLAQYAGQVIKQGNKRFQVMQGADGKYFAQELK